MILLCLSLGVVAFLLFRWSRWLAKRPKAPPALRHVPWVLLALFGYGACHAAGGLVESLGAVEGESVDPSQKARVLAEGISATMNCFAFLTLVVVVAVLALGLGTLRWRR